VSWSNYRWAWNVRGVSSSEQLVLLYLADQANGEGEIRKLSINRITAACHGLDRRRVQRILGELTEKSFILARVPRRAPRGNQVSNAYRIDLGRYHPPDPIGAKLWGKCLREVQAEKLISQERLEVFSDRSSAYYERGHLAVWVNSEPASRAFREHAFHLRSRFRDHDPPVLRLEILSPA